MAVMSFAWDNAKNAQLMADRGIGFEDIVFHIERGDQHEWGYPASDDQAAPQVTFVLWDGGAGPFAVGGVRSARG